MRRFNVAQRGEDGLCATRELLLPLRRLLLGQSVVHLPQPRHAEVGRRLRRRAEVDADGGLVAALYGLDRLALWLEDRGWLYYRRKKPECSPASCLVAMSPESYIRW